MDEDKTQNKPQGSEETTEQQSAPAAPGEQPQAPQTDKKDGGENVDNVKAVAAVAYLGILFFVPLLTNPESDFARFHANQGLLLLITGLVVNILGPLLPVIGWFIIWPLGSIFVLVLFIMGLINAMNGEKKPLPLIGGIQLIK